MSPFGHLGFHIGHGRDIDRDFSPMLHYMDGLDRHFFHGHRLISSFIPRFDLEEDDSFYYLIGDIPGAKAEDIIIEPSDDHTLIIHGDIRRFDFSDGPSIAHKALHDSCGQIVREMVQEGNAGEVHVTNETNKPATPVTLPPQGHIRHGTTSYIEDTEKSKERSRKRVLLSERLTGDFRRTFTFPTPFVEETARATIKNGVLNLVIPKREKTTAKLRKIPVAEGY